VETINSLLLGRNEGGWTMAKSAKGNDELSNIAYLLRSLLAIELWRGGLTQKEIGKRLGIATVSVNTILKGVSRLVPLQTNSEE